MFSRMALPQLHVEGMRELDRKTPDVARVIAARSLRSQYQPIFSVLNRSVVGVEALARATDPDTHQPIAPLPLFEAAQQQGLTLALDRLCREKAVEGFVTAPMVESEQLLFLNLDVSILEEGIVGSGHLIQLVEQHGLSPSRVVIELIESRIQDMSAVHRFLDTHRERGFLIALDDVGAGNSNLDRIVDLAPNILKLDRSLVSGLDKDYRKQEVFACCMRVAHKLGVVVIAEGIETQSEALACLERGADLMQGYLFARPAFPGPAAHVAEGLATAQAVGAVMKERQREQFLAKKARYRMYDAAANRIGVVVGETPAQAWVERIASELGHYPFVECAYVLDEAGMQITETIFGPGRGPAVRSLLFSPAAAGVDQSSKDYFLCLGPTQRRFVTDPYISRATGRLCVTLSAVVSLPGGRTVVVCVDTDSNAPVPHTDRQHTGA
jgi:EAL domain-containing protein (putative c-di-GMP-specific phosphodiesterase class I)